MLLKQVGTMEEYKSQFHQLVYNIHLYEPSISDTMLVTRFILDLKEERRAAVELQLPTPVQLATMYAMVQERLLTQSKGDQKHYSKRAVQQT